VGKGGDDRRRGGGGAAGGAQAVASDGGVIIVVVLALAQVNLTGLHAVLHCYGGAKLRSPICPPIIISRVSSLLREQKGVIDLKKGKMRMVPGFHFLPSDCELIIHYLLRKVKGEEIPWDGILDFEL
jgi:hypothetical protein